MRSFTLFALVVGTGVSLFAQDGPPAGRGARGGGGGEQAPASVAFQTRIAGMKHMPGFYPLDWDERNGHIYIEVSGLDAKGHSPDFLYTNTLTYGTGSNDLGLDRGQTAGGLVVHFERTGPKLLLVQDNDEFRSSASDPAEQLAVKQSFPVSVLYGFSVITETPDHATLLVDATDFFVRDAHSVGETLVRMNQGAYRLDASRSTIVPEDTKVFPKNDEVEAELTFTAEGGGGGRGGGGGEGGGRARNYVRDVTPDAHAMTIQERQSFVELPALSKPGDPMGFQPRVFNPRSGYFQRHYRDYTIDLGQSLDQQVIERHRLIKKDPNCVSKCEAVTPIQYYVDRGAPEPIRAALLEGARWWDQAFQVAGWAPGTFKVDYLPADADPMDVRYNIIQWVHRYTRGWSYGAAVTDPRTGEILKGNVTLGSLRARQDFMIAESLLSPYKSDKFDEATIAKEQKPILEMVLARIRQLAAHETGHTLGLAHNFAASSISQSDSVMDYPHPNVQLTADGQIDLSHAYAVNIGGWDKVAIDYGYRQFKPGTDERAALEKILTDADKAGQIFLTDEDARPFSSVSPIDHLWDNGKDAADELDRVLKIREVGLKNFGEAAIKPYTPMAQLQDTLVTLYLFHRYQTEAAIKMIGGLSFTYNERGDGLANPSLIPNDQQKKALAEVLKTLSPEVLTVPENILAVMPPRPPGLSRTQESLPSHTATTFDPVAAAESAADLTLQVLFDPARAARMVQYHMREKPTSPSLREMLEAVSKTVAVRPANGHTMAAEVERAVETRAVEGMFALAANPQSQSQVKAITISHLEDLLKQWTTEPAPTDSAEAIHRRYMVERINEFKADPDKFAPAKPLEAPPGMPIGDDDEFDDAPPM